MPLLDIHKRYAPQIARMDQSENPFGFLFNRYPDWDNEQNALSAYCAFLNRDNIGPDQIGCKNLAFVRGAADGIDLILRTLIAPNELDLTLTNPTFFPIPLWASLYRIRYQLVDLLHDDLNDMSDVMRQAHPDSAVMIINPANPTGTYIRKEVILNFAAERPGLVIVDEAYVDFLPEESVSRHVNEYPNLLVIRSLSKAWGLAGLRAGFVVGTDELISSIKNYQPPFMMDTITADYIHSIISKEYDRFCNMRSLIIEQREFLINRVKLNTDCHVYPSVTNFAAIGTANATNIVENLAETNIAVKATAIKGLPYIKISVGLPSENIMLADALIRLLTEK